MRKVSIKIEKQGWEPNIREDEGSFFAFHPYLPGVVSSGISEAEARENWQDALNMFLEHCKEFDLLIPDPTHFTVRFVPATNTEVETSSVTATFAHC